MNDNMNGAPAKSFPQVIEPPELHPTGREGPSILSGNLDVIKNVKVKLTIRVGETIVSVSELMQMKADHILKLDTSIETPVDILLDDNIVARGQLVAVDDNFGVRITELPKAGHP